MNWEVLLCNDPCEVALLQCKYVVPRLTKLTKYMVPRIIVFIRLEVLQFDAILKLDVGTRGLVNLLLNLCLMLF